VDGFSERRDIILQENLERENGTVLRVVSLLVAMLLLAGWVVPVHACTETKPGATIHCAEVDECDTSAVLVQDGAIIIGPQILPCSQSHLTLIPQLSVSTIYRPPQA
jgi:hypothetical protein